MAEKTSDNWRAGIEKLALEQAEKLSPEDVRELERGHFTPGMLRLQRLLQILGDDSQSKPA
jgi:hypothetical protein